MGSCTAAAKATEPLFEFWSQEILLVLIMLTEDKIETAWLIACTSQHIIYDQGQAVKEVHYT